MSGASKHSVLSPNAVSLKSPMVDNQANAMAFDDNNRVSKFENNSAAAAKNTAFNRQSNAKYVNKLDSNQ